MPDLPPIIPLDSAALQQAIMLLGNRAKHEEVSNKLRAQLTKLIGRCPQSVEQAQGYKVVLKRLAKWEAEDNTPLQGEVAPGGGSGGQGGVSVAPEAVRLQQVRARALSRLQAES